MARKKQEDPKAEMTPMIDVVFQLMIFFIVTIKQEDIFSKLNANRPAPNAGSAQSEENDTQIKIDIGRGGVVLNGRGMSFQLLDASIKKLAANSTKATVIVRQSVWRKVCMPHSEAKTLRLYVSTIQLTA